MSRYYNSNSNEALEVLNLFIVGRRWVEGILQICHNFNDGNLTITPFAVIRLC